MNIRMRIGRLTSPFFVPLRRLVVWMDNKFGTCDHQLVLQPRACYLELPESPPIQKISELERKVSKDKANMVGLGSDTLKLYMSDNKEE